MLSPSLSSVGAGHALPSRQKPGQSPGHRIGVLIRGATSHYEYVAAEAARGLGDCARRGGCPVTYGVVTAENQEQALERCGGKIGNRGWDAALAAIEMARLSGAISDGEGFSKASRS